MLIQKTDRNVVGLREAEKECKNRWRELGTKEGGQRGRETRIPTATKLFNIYIK